MSVKGRQKIVYPNPIAVNVGSGAWVEKESPVAIQNAKPVSQWMNEAHRAMAEVEEAFDMLADSLILVSAPPSPSTACGTQPKDCQTLSDVASNFRSLAFKLQDLRDRIKHVQSVLEI